MQQSWFEQFIDYPLESMGFVWVPWEGPHIPWTQQTGEKAAVPGIFSQQEKDLEQEAQWRARGRSYDPTVKPQTPEEQGFENPLFRAVAWLEQFIDYPIETAKGWKAEDFNESIARVKERFEGWAEESKLPAQQLINASKSFQKWLANREMLQPIMRMEAETRKWVGSQTLGFIETTQEFLGGFGIEQQAFYGDIKAERIHDAESQARQIWSNEEAWRLYSEPNYKLGITPFILQEGSYPGDWGKIARNLEYDKNIQQTAPRAIESVMWWAEKRKQWRKEWEKGPLFGKGPADISSLYIDPLFNIKEYLTLENQMSRLMWPRSQYWKQGVPVAGMADWLAKKKQCRGISDLGKAKRNYKLGRIAG